MAKTHYVKHYRGKRKCQRKEGDALNTICGLPKVDHAPSGTDHTAGLIPHVYKGGTLTCEKCHEPIKVGDPYKWVKPKSGPYGGHKRNRCDTCPSWQPSELTSSPFLSVLYRAEESDPGWSGDTPEEMEESLKDRATHFSEAAQEMADIRTEAADNMEEGFGHETYQSEELREVGERCQEAADELDSWEPSYEFDFDPDPEDPEDGLSQALETWAEEQAGEIDSTWEQVQG
jgi:hypothetical protein